MTYQPTGGYITDVPYTWHFARELAPAWLDMVAVISGVEPPSRERFTWCELGCGYGLTPTILASTHPRGQFCGIDFNSTHIESAKRFAAECETENIEFHHVDFTSAIESVAGGFDYIVLHGIYSWVDKQDQSALLRFIDRHLNPGGLVFVSYNAMPGRAADLPFQRLVRALGLTLSGDSASRCFDAISIVQTLTELNTPALTGSPMATRLSHIPPEKYNRRYLAHELMSGNWDPLCVTDVRATMRGIGLDPVGSATLMENFDSFILGNAARKSLLAISDPDARELARDFLINQLFRRDVYVRNGRILDENSRRSGLLRFAFALTLPTNMVEYATKTPAGHLRYDNPTARTIVAALANGTRSLANVCEEFALDSQDALANALVLSAAGTVRPVERDDMPVDKLNQAIGRRFGSPEEIPFVALPCGTALPVNDEMLR
jgi:SAM-dependent methyltransferase